MRIQYEDSDGLRGELRFDQINIGDHVRARADTEDMSGVGPDIKEGNTGEVEEVYGDHTIVVMLDPPHHAGSFVELMPKDLLLLVDARDDRLGPGRIGSFAL